MSKPIVPVGIVVGLLWAAPALADTWTTGDVDDHITASATLTYNTDSLSASSYSEVEIKYGLWNSPDCDLSVYLNGSYVGVVTADAGYVSPGPAYQTWVVTTYLTSGVNTFEVSADSGCGEAVVGRLDLTYTPATVDEDDDGYYEGEDCDDTDPDIHPGAAERCNGLDDDCDGSPASYEADVDLDGWMACEGDCDDEDDTRNPGASELCNGIDDNCDDALPPGETDGDTDGYADCEGDCDDEDSSVHPGATEICNGEDDNCDSILPDDEADLDSDGFLACEDDCDDDAADANPDGTEVCGDGIDQDCVDGDLVCDEPEDTDPVDPGRVGGCSCNAVGPGLAWGLLPLLAIALRRRRR